jgi:hypothetical protein
MREKYVGSRSRQRTTKIPSFAPGDEDVIACDLVAAKLVEVVAGYGVGGADLDPVVALAAHQLLIRHRAADEVVAWAAEGFTGIRPCNDEVVAEAADEQVFTIAALDNVITGIAVNGIVTAGIRDDVIAVAAFD